MSSTGKRKAEEALEEEEADEEKEPESSKRPKVAGYEAVNRVKDALEEEEDAISGSYGELCQKYQELQDEYSRLKAELKFEEALKLQQECLASSTKLDMAEIVSAAYEYSRKEEEYCSKTERLKDATEWKEFAQQATKLWPELETYDDALRPESLPTNIDKLLQGDGADEDDDDGEGESGGEEEEEGVADPSQALPKKGAKKRKVTFGDVTPDRFFVFINSPLATMTTRRSKYAGSREISFFPKDEPFVHNPANNSIRCTCCNRDFVTTKAAKNHVISEAHQMLKLDRRLKQQQRLSFGVSNGIGPRAIDGNLTFDVSEIKAANGAIVGDVDFVKFARFISGSKISMTPKKTKAHPDNRVISFYPRDEPFVHDPTNKTIVCTACKKVFRHPKAAKSHVITEEHQLMKTAGFIRDEMRQEPLYDEDEDEDGAEEIGDGSASEMRIGDPARLPKPGTFQGNVTMMQFSRFMNCRMVTMLARSSRTHPEREITFFPRDEPFVYDTANSSVFCDVCQKSFRDIKSAKNHVITDSHQDYKQGVYKLEKHPLESLKRQLEQTQSTVESGRASLAEMKQSLSAFIEEFKLKRAGGGLM